MAVALTFSCNIFIIFVLSCIFFSIYSLKIENFNLKSSSVICYDESKGKGISCPTSEGCDIYGNGCSKTSFPELAIFTSLLTLGDSKLAKSLRIIRYFNFIANDANLNHPSFIREVEKLKVIRKNEIQRKLKNLYFLKCEKLLSNYIDLKTSSTEIVYEKLLSTYELYSSDYCNYIFEELIIEFTEIDDFDKEYRLNSTFKKKSFGLEDYSIPIDSKYNARINQRKKLYKEPENDSIVGLIKTPFLLAKKVGSDILSSIFYYKEMDLSKYTRLDISLLPGNYSILEKYQDNFDLTLVRDQSKCGSCWAFSTAEVFSDRRTIHALSHGDHSWDKSVASAWDVASCTPFGLGCHGGNPIFGLYYGKVYGIVSGGPYEYKNTGNSCQPYQIWPCRNNPNITPHQAELCKDPENFQTKCTHKCLDPLFKKSYIQDKSFSKSYSVIYDSHVRRVLSDLFTYGPHSVMYRVYKDFEEWDWNKWPVYYHKAGAYLGGHAVKLVGYGFDQKTKMTYWLCVNSWSNKWGIKGTFKIHRGDIEGRKEFLETLIDEWMGMYVVSYFGDRYL